MSLGDSIRSVRRERGLTQQQVADAAGINRSTLVLLESGKIQDLGIRKVERVLRFLGLELMVRPLGAPPTLEELRRDLEVR